MPAEYLVEHVDSNPVLMQFPSVHEQLYKAFRSKAYQPEKSLDQLPSREYDGPNWTWNATVPLTVSNRGKTVASNLAQNRSALGTKKLNKLPVKKWSVKVDKLENGGWCGIGLAGDNAKNLSFTGSESMWMCSANSYVWPAQQMNGFGFAEGDVITVHLQDNKLHYSKNGKPTGISVTGFDEKNVYPVATVQRATVTLLPTYV
jgi:hypothetical protein